MKHGARLRSALKELAAMLPMVAISLAFGVGAVKSLGSAQAQAQQQPTPQQAFDSAKAIGTQRAQTDGQAVRNGQSEAVIANTVQGYTTNPQEKQYYNTKDTQGPTAAMQAQCAANPSEAVCSSTKIGTTKRPPHGLTPASPVFAGQEAARNPTSVLGDVANTYNACAVGGEMTTPAQWQHHTCTLDTGSWQSEPCTKTLTVKPVDTYSCVAGAVLATKTLGGGSDTMTVTAYCPAGGGTKVPFKFEAKGGHGSCSGPINATLDLGQAQPQGGAAPATVGTLSPHWGGSCFSLAVHWETAGCANGQCATTVHFVQDPGTQPVLQCTQPGQVLGSAITWYVDPQPVNAATACYTGYADDGAALGQPGAYGEVGGQVQFWVDSGPAANAGWQWAPGVHHQTTLAFAEPIFQPASGDKWSSTCDSQEARTPLLPKDGITPPVTGPVMPVMGQNSQPQCARTTSVCTDGPSTKVIDGVAVTRECWSYSNNFECTAVAPSSTCTSTQFASCSLSDTATCLQTDANGHCVQAQMGYDCKTADAVFTPSLNCGNASYCAGGSCWDSTKTSNTSFAYSVAQLNAHVEAGKDMDVDGQNIQIFKGQDRRCHINLFGIDNCCTDSAYIQQCTQEEQDTYQWKSQGRCHELGEYCSNKTVLGICVEKTRSACCFSSLLARVVQEQGRAQLGIAWGDVKSPECRGFTPTELTTMDWSQFDLSEFYASINPTPLDQGQTTGGAAGKQPACYYGQGKC